MLPPRAEGATAEAPEIREESSGDLELDVALYEELRRYARGLMRRERDSHTLEPTALVHEAIAKILGGVPRPAAETDLIVAAMRAMKEILVDHARRRGRQKRGGGWRRHALDRDLAQFEEQGIDVEALHEAIDRLAEFNPRLAEMIRMRHLMKLTAGEIAELFGLASKTVENQISFALGWLRRRLKGDGDEDEQECPGSRR